MNKVKNAYLETSGGLSVQKFLKKWAFYS
nr:hypothetical protein [Cytobacillus purgationiresistens]